MLYLHICTSQLSSRHSYWLFSFPHYSYTFQQNYPSFIHLLFYNFCHTLIPNEPTFDKCLCQWVNTSLHWKTNKVWITRFLKNFNICWSKKAIYYIWINCVFLLPLPPVMMLAVCVFQFLGPTLLPSPPGRTEPIIITIIQKLQQTQNIKLLSHTFDRQNNKHR